MGPDHPEGGKPITRGRRFLLWAPVGAMLAMQVFLSSQSQLPPVPLLHFLPGSDKVEHAGWFFLLGLLVWRAARNGEGFDALKMHLAALADARP